MTPLFGNNSKAAVFILVLCFAQAAAAENVDLSSGSWRLPIEGRPIGLDESYRLALKRSEQIAQSEDSVKQALARVDELKTDIFPQIAASGTELFQENPNIPGFSNTINRTSLPQAQITLQQPLFSGFREFLAFKQSKIQARSLLSTEERAKDLLYQDVAQAYYGLLSFQDQIRVSQDIIRTYEDRIRQLRYWFSIGRSRESEVLAARSQLAQTEAQVELLRGQEDSAQELLKFLTGLDERLKPKATSLPGLDPIDVFLKKAEHRSDVEATRENLEAGRLATEIARCQRWPLVGLNVDYYFIRSGFAQPIHYDAQLSASVPVFDWGRISAQTRESAAAEDSAARALSLAERTAERDVRTAYQTLRRSIESVDALNKAQILGRDNVKAQSDDYRHGLVTNIDVINSINALQSVETSLSSAKWSAAFAAAQLQVASGQHP